MMFAVFIFLVLLAVGGLGFLAGWCARAGWGD